MTFAQLHLLARGERRAHDRAQQAAGRHRKGKGSASQHNMSARELARLMGGGGRPRGG